LNLFGLSCLLFLTPVAMGQVIPSSVPVCIACRADLAQIRSGYSATDWTALTQGEIVTSDERSIGPNGTTRGIVGSTAILPQTATQVWSVLTDFEARADFLPTMKESRIVRIDGNRVWVAERLRIFFVNIYLQAISTLHPEEGSITWVLDRTVKNDIADSTGSWQIVAITDGRTLASYHARLDTGRPVPHFVEDLLTRRSLPKVMEGLRTEVARRFSETAPVP
jgi:ribosome-associated toxin RatA of RatAB toxin-antitoxin module